MILRWKYEKYQIARLQHNPVTVSAGSSRVRFWYIFQGAGKKYLEKNIRYLVVGGQDVIRRLVSVVGWYWRGNRTRVSGWDPTYFDSPSCGPAVRYVQGTVRPGRAGLRQWGEERPPAPDLMMSEGNNTRHSTRKTFKYFIRTNYLGSVHNI